MTDYVKTQFIIDHAGCNLAELNARVEAGVDSTDEYVHWIALMNIPGVLTPPTLVW